MSEESINPSDMERTADSLIRELERWLGARCANCGAATGAHQVLMSIAMGFKNAPRCVGCLAMALNVEPGSFGISLLEYVRERECYLAAWNWANRQAGFPENVLSLTILGSVTELKMSASDADSSWDAGEMGCGDLVLELRFRLQELQAGEVLELCARDPGAREDLPAWCRLTGHTLLRADHPNYWIKRKE